MTGESKKGKREDPCAGFQNTPSAEGVFDFLSKTVAPNSSSAGFLPEVVVHLAK